MRGVSFESAPADGSYMTLRLAGGKWDAQKFGPQCVVGYAGRSTFWFGRLTLHLSTGDGGGLDDVYVVSRNVGKQPGEFVLQQVGVTPGRRLYGPVPEVVCRH